MGALLYIVVFILSLGTGIAVNKQFRYTCCFEPYITSVSTEVYMVEEVKKGGTVNINTATVSELTTLNGIGVKLAERVVKFRDENGKFEVKEDIMKVPGIGEKKFENIRDYIKID